LALAVPLSRFTSRVGGGSAFFVRPLVHTELQSHFRHPTIKLTIWVSVLCLLPTLANWGGWHFPLPYLLFPLPCLVCDALHVLSWSHSFIWISVILGCQMPVYAALLRFFHTWRTFALCALVLIFIHVTAIFMCMSTRPLSYHGG